MFPLIGRFGELPRHYDHPIFSIPNGDGFSTQGVNRRRQTNNRIELIVRERRQVDAIGRYRIPGGLRTLKLL